MPRRLILAVLAVLALFPGRTLLAQGPVTVSGVVTTREDGLPLPGATVAIESLNVSATTDAQGRYRLEVPATAVGQSVDLKASFAGLNPRVVPVKLTGTLTHDFALGLGFHEEITVGSRAAGAEAEKAVPVDVISARQIEATGLSETMQVIQALAPSFNFPRPTITDGTDSVRPATLRSLGPDQVLVLINGKRRHTSALVHLNGSIGRGSTGVDLNAIPVTAIERIEVLRDGAAAQYGSDAIAGVINIVTRSGAGPLNLSFKGGSTTHSDGELVDGGANYGFHIGRGALNVTAEYRDRNATNRAGNDPRDQLRPGDANNNPVPQPNHHWGDADETDMMTFADLNVPVGSSETTFFYGFGGWSKREGSHGGFYRRGLDARNWPSIYPLGYLPLIEPSIIDSSATLGIRGTKSQWFWDASAQYGHNSFEFNVTNSLNVSLGPTVPPNQTDFYAGTLQFNQYMLNLDARREVEIGLAGPLNVAIGAELRRENYQIGAGEPASYEAGTSRDQFGNQAPLGAQVFPGFRPANEVDENRDNVAAYVDLEGNVVGRLRLGLAGRYEHYSDFGSTADGKVTLRFEPVTHLILRGAASTGFRAPSLGQSFFSSTATNFVNVPGQGLVPFESLTMPVGSPQAQALGAQPLRPEESVNYSGGIVWNPVSAFEATLDFYRIKISDRVVLSGNFNQPQVAALLRPLGGHSGRFFTNAIDTVTKGVEATAHYRFNLGTSGTLGLTGSYSGPLGANSDSQDPYYATRIVGTIDTPPQLAGLEATLFDRIERRRIECGQPKDNFRIGGDWSNKGWAASVLSSRYGEYCSFTLSPADDQIYSPKWLTDVDLAYGHKRFVVHVGAQNIFDEFPDLNTPVNSFNGIQTYPSQSPFGMNGRFVYGRVTFKF
jgi:iron complex outermembrane receptor protein